MSEFMSTLLFGDNQEFESFLAEELQGFMARLRQIESHHDSSSSASRISLLFLIGDDHEALNMAQGATIEYIEKLEKVTMEGSGMVYAVCLDEMSIGSEARRLPCSHVYHSNCIVEWLEKNKTCPCRTS
ncbi:E3 ubiquitin-protein ligase SIRP1-like [Hevea brasiliensis]|uniref:E3 ubiquitin-protein ligase SIRP1-like n=1 Tax=Hevea brasiliensis TaxID=3981 RepID=UPI0025F877B5|nr:E3 ubiquitin-protein ligase SIRP1-like [Hevea brasiliensis]